MISIYLLFNKQFTKCKHKEFTKPNKHFPCVLWTYYNHYLLLPKPCPLPFLLPIPLARPRPIPSDD